MKIEISKKQFKFLLELVHLGNWVVNSNNEPNTIDKKYEEITNIIYSYGKKAGLEKYIVYSKHSQVWIGTDYLYMKSNANKLLEKYNEHNFWSHLIEKLAWKDFHKKYSKEKIQRMSSSERIEKIYEFIDKYTQEIDDNSINHLEIIKRIPKGK
ncbi:MAG: hypothetical protein WC873_04190 [Candidatus Gracilibacteria bacterium]